MRARHILLYTFLDNIGNYLINEESIAESSYLTCVNPNIVIYSGITVVKILFCFFERG